MISSGNDLLKFYKIKRRGSCAASRSGGSPAEAGSRVDLSKGALGKRTLRRDAGAASRRGANALSWNVKFPAGWKNHRESVKFGMRFSGLPMRLCALWRARGFPQAFWPLIHRRDGAFAARNTR